MIYSEHRWRGAALIPNVDPQIVWERVVALGTPRAIVADAEPEDSLLHPAFTWDVVEGMEQLHLQQARALARATILITRNEDGQESQQQPSVISVIDKGTGERTYKGTLEVMADEDYRQEALVEALIQYQALGARYRKFRELARIRKAVDEVAELVAAREKVPA